MGNHDSSRYERKKTYQLKERVKRLKKIRLPKDPAKQLRLEYAQALRSFGPEVKVEATDDEA